MKNVSAGNQQVRHPLYDASGVIAAGGTPQLLLAQSQARSHLLVQNTSDDELWLEVGAARAVATIVGGVITAVALTNAGFLYRNPPVVHFLGGGNAGNSSYQGLGQPNGASPNSQLGAGRPGRAVASIVGGAVTAITIEDGGAGYVAAPYVYLANSDLDPYGVAVPSVGSGIRLLTGGSFVMESTDCTTDALAIFGATTGQGFTCKWMD